MEINKNGVGGTLYESNYTQNSIKTATTQGATSPHQHQQHKITVRRRCRSESLQIPSLPGQTSNKNKNNINSVAQQQMNGTKKLFPIIEQNGRGRSCSGKDNIKENILQSSALLNFEVLSGKGPEISDLKEAYLNDMELYKEHVKNSHFNHKNNHVLDFDKLFDNHKRRARTRSESEPHEIYHTKYNQNQNIGTNERNEIRMKRARDDDTTISPIKQTNGVVLNQNYNEMINLSLLRDSSPKIVTTNLINLNKTNGKLSNGSSNCPNKASAINGQRTKVKRAVTPTLKTKPNISIPMQLPKLKTPVDSPQPPPSSSKYKDIVQTSETTSDTECSSLDDDDFDGDDIGEIDEGEITDEEDSYVNQAKITPSEKSIVPPSVSIDCCVAGKKYLSSAAPLSPSLFPFVPPYITFASHGEKGPPMPPSIQKILKWKLTTITPIVVRRVLLNTGFRLLRKTNDWMGTWGKHMKSPCFKTIRSYQKFNHIPGSFQIGRKDRVWRNLQLQMTRHGKKEFGFMPKTYIIPQDLKLLRQQWQRYSQRNVKWIIKPPASARGTGIKVVNRWSQIPKRKPLIVQRYIEKPLLINGSKFDLRLYVLVTSMNPLKIFMHTDGLARFASVKYSEKSDTLSDRYMHLTNYSINKLSANYTNNEDHNACKGHKWTVKSLWTFLSAQGVNTNRLWGALRNLCIRTVLAGEGPINTMTKLNLNSKYNSYELFGVDVILDSELIPWLLEVNISPSLHSASPLDLHVKGPLVTGLLNTCLYQVPPKLSTSAQKDVSAQLNLKEPICYDKKLYYTALSKAERLKHSKFTHRLLICREDYIDAILENLTPDDVRCLINAEDELARSSPLERIFPTPNTYKYLIFTENHRYYNRLLDAWENRYGKKREEGIAYLKQLCEKKIHLEVPVIPVQKDSRTPEEDEIGDEICDDDKEDSKQFEEKTSTKNNREFISTATTATNTDESAKKGKYQRGISYENSAKE